jgi:trimeric autotransporter adhesin
MRNRTRMIAAAAAVTAALAAGGTATALASTTGTKPSAHATTASASMRCAPDSNLAGLLGVSQARLDRALRAAKTSLSTASATPTEDKLQVALARYLGISQARVRHAFAAEKPCDSKPVGSKPACPQPAGSKSPDSKAAASKAAASKAAASKAAAKSGHEALAAAVAGKLHVTLARVNAALRPIFAAGHADPSSPVFAAAARSLGVSTQQLSAALVYAKQSLAGCS